MEFSKHISNLLRFARGHPVWAIGPLALLLFVGHWGNFQTLQPVMRWADKLMIEWLGQDWANSAEFRTLTLVVFVFLLWRGGNVAAKAAENAVRDETRVRSESMKMPTTLIRLFARERDLQRSKAQALQVQSAIEQHLKEMDRLKAAPTRHYDGRDWDPLGRMAKQANEHIKQLEIYAQYDKPNLVLRMVPPHIIQIPQATPIRPLTEFDPSLNEPYFNQHEADHAELVGRLKDLNNFIGREANVLEQEKNKFEQENYGF